MGLAGVRAGKASRNEGGDPSGAMKTDAGSFSCAAASCGTAMAASSAQAAAVQSNALDEATDPLGKGRFANPVVLADDPGIPSPAHSG